MKYCIDYKRGTTIINKVDEINIFCDHTSIYNVIDYIYNHPNQRTNIKLHDKKEIMDYNLIDQLCQLVEELPENDIALVFPKFDKDYIDRLHTNNSKIKFFFDVLIREWETLNYFIKLGVSDVYIIEQLCFELKDVAEFAHKNNVQVRTFPNISQKTMDATPAIKGFFIRPEDIPFYEEYIDVLEFFDMTKKSIETLLKIYTETKKWYGDLKELIIGLDCEFDSRFITPRFCERRLNCQRKCLKGKSCNFCDNVQELATTLKKNGIMFEEVKARTDTTLKAANVTGQSGQAISEQLTAVWNGYKVTAEINDKKEKEEKNG